MSALALFVAFVAAKLIVVPLQLWTSSGWAPIALVWQDALAALLFAAAARLLQAQETKRLRPVLFWMLIAYTAINVPVERALGTPLTWPMLRAAGGPLTDSFLVYLTWTNVVLMLAIAACGWLARIRTLPAKAAWTLAATGALLVVIGPAASRRAYAHGLDRNVVAAVVSSVRPRVAAEPRDGDWRRSPIDEPQRSDDLSHLAGVGRNANIILVSLESTAAQYLGLHGATPDPMPNLTALAETGVTFDHAYAVYPESIKGLYSMLCSAFPAFDTNVEIYAHRPCQSVAGVLTANGYRTGLFHSGRFGYLGMNGIIRDRGYQTLEDAGDIGGEHESSFGVDDQTTVTRMLAWIDALPRGQRFALTYLPVSGHHPYEAPRVPQFAVTTDLDRYRSALHYGDAALGALMAGLRARGLDRNTLWILYGDHGEAFGQHPGNFGHTFFLYDENVRVPFVIAAPGRMSGGTHVSRVVSLVDTVPTLLDIAGIATPSTYQGRSMLLPDPEVALFFTDYSLSLAGLRDGRWKYILDLSAARSELFDMATDPGESSNLAAARPDLTSQYKAHVTGWIEAERSRVQTASSTH